MMEPGTFLGRELPGFSMSFSTNRFETEAYFSIEKYPDTFDEKQACQTIQNTLAEMLSFGIDRRFISNELPRLIARRVTFPSRKIATGIQPLDGVAAEIDILVPRPSMEHLTRPDGTLDFKTRDLFRSVSTDEIILVKRPATKGETGHSVFGKSIPAVPGRDKRVVAGRNVVLKSDGTNDIARAACEGQLAVESGMNSITVHVTPVMVIPGNVDFETGHISFKGSLIVRGSIRYGFSVTVTGNLRVDGVIEAGTRVTVGGDLDVGKGILGSPGKAQETNEVKVFGNLRAMYAENACLTVQGDLFLRSVLNSRINANGEVMIEKSLSGGELISFRSITAGELGNAVGVTTRVSCGVSHTALNRLNLVVKIINDIRRQHYEAEKNLLYIKNFPEKLPPGKAEPLRASLEHKVASLGDQITKLELKKADLALVLLEETRSTISAGVFRQGVVLSIRASRMVIDSDRSLLTFYQKIPEERIEFKPYIPGKRRSSRPRS